MSADGNKKAMWRRQKKKNIKSDLTWQKKKKRMKRKEKKRKEIKRQ
jgi:hypothetical protein